MDFDGHIYVAKMYQEEINQEWGGEPYYIKRIKKQLYLVKAYDPISCCNTTEVSKIGLRWIS